jgi:hypothetical protein
MSDASPASPRSPNERWFIAAALALVWLGALAALWSVLCRQSPGSSYLVRGYYEPIEALAQRLWTVAAITVGCARLASRGALFSRENTARAWVIFALWLAGASLSTGAMTYSGATGTLGVQARDSGQPAHRVLVVRWAGGALLLAALAAAQRSILRGADELTSR